jgi:lysophospholipase L1-like esterase
MKWRRLVVLICIGLFLIAGGVLLKAFWLAMPEVGSGPAGPKVPDEPFRQVWTQRKVLLLGVGDSVTQGFGAGDPCHSYFNRLAKNPDDEYDDMRGSCLSAVLPHLDTLNTALPCTTSLQHVEFLEKRFEKRPADVFGLVVMTSGGNDIIHDYGKSPPEEGAMYGATLEQAQPWIANFEKRLDRMIDLLESKFPGGCAIFLADIYDPTDGVGDAHVAGFPRWRDCMKILDAYNEVIHRCAARRESVHLVPMHDEFLGHGFHQAQRWRKHYDAEDPYFWYYGNVEDPNHRGYDAIRRLFLLEIVKAKDKIVATPAAAKESDISPPK